MPEHSFEPNRFVWGAGCAGRLEDLAEEFGIDRAIVVCGENVGSNAHLMEAIESGLEDTHVHTFKGVRGHTPLETVKRGVEVMNDCRADGLVSVGGGAASDTAKAIAILAAETDRSIHEMKSQTDEDGNLYHPNLPEDKVPILSVATTLSAAEVSAALGVKDEEAGEKAGLIDEQVRPKACLYDPELLATTPSSVIASTGMNALNHAVEVLYSDSRGSNLFYQATAEKSIRLLTENLPYAIVDEPDLDTIQSAAVGAALSALGLVGGICINHGINHAVCARYPVSHGDGNSILLPHGITYNNEVVPERIDRIARAFGIDPDERRDVSTVDTLITEIHDFQDELGVPSRLREVDVGYDENAFGEIAEIAASDFAMASNPRRVTAGDVEQILRDAW